MRSSPAILTFAASAICAHGIVTFTGTYEGSSDLHYGYIIGQEYSFSFTLNPDWTNGYIVDNESYYRWERYSPMEDAVFSAVEGSGVSGSYNGMIASVEVSSTYESTFFQIGDFSGFDPTGLVTPDGLTTISYLSAVAFDGVPHTPLNGYEDLNDYFAGFNGNYPVNGFIDIAVSEEEFGGMGPTFSLTSVNFTAVPEPSTYAGILGAVGLLIVCRRRKKFTC